MVPRCCPQCGNTVAVVIVGEGRQLVCLPCFGVWDQEMRDADAALEDVVAAEHGRTTRSGGRRESMLLEAETAHAAYRRMVDLGALLGRTL